jgi:hypothetical protein
VIQSLIATTAQILYADHTLKPIDKILAFIYIVNNPPPSVSFSSWNETRVVKHALLRIAGNAISSGADMSTALLQGNMDIITFVVVRAYAIATGYNGTAMNFNVVDLEGEACRLKLRTARWLFERGDCRGMLVDRESSLDALYSAVVGDVSRNGDRFSEDVESVFDVR